MSEKVGFIGQGFIGKHMADEFEGRGYETIRYSVDEPYVNNHDRIAEAEVTFIAVPTPTTPEGFDSSIIQSVLPIVGKGNTAVIKSTILPGTTEKLQNDFPDITVMHSPEFLREKSAAYDTAHPERNIIGIVRDDAYHRKLGQKVLDLLPKASHEFIVPARDAEAIKYIGNTFLAAKVAFFNAAYEFAKSSNADWETVRQIVTADSRIGAGHTNVVDQSGADSNPGRGAGGHCFPKDTQALVNFMDEIGADEEAAKFFRTIVGYNEFLMRSTGKDLDILKDIYGQ